MHEHDHEHDDGGLAQDLKLLRASMERRALLRFALGASLLPLIGCGGADTSGDGTDSDGDRGPVPG
jgi:hypothetical protein